MKRFIIIFVFLLLKLSVFGEKVQKQVAKEVALQFISNQGIGEQKIVKEILEESKDGIVAYYIVNYDPEGWALIAADDRVKPVLAYSHTGRFYNNESITSPEAKYWINNYKEQIHSVVKENTLSKNKDWDKLLDGDETYTKSAVGAVTPLLEVAWNQNSGWNRFCPVDEDGPGGHAYVGCVAVAMAQAMSATKYPVAPQGEHRYFHEDYGTIYLNYNKEVTYNWNNMSLKSADDENARLLYHCAVAVSMDFGADGSGTLSSKIAGALREHFGYSDDLKYYERFEDDAEWMKLLKSELDKGNILIYSGDPGTGEPGHCFNIDGYDINSYFHFNWGWSGKYNGYYSINNINPGDDRFNVNQNVVTGVAQPYFGPTDITLSNLIVEEGLPVGSFVATVEVKDNSTVDLFSYELDGGPKFPKGRNEASFYIENDSLKTKYEFDSSVKDEYILNIKVTDMEANEYTEEFLIKIKPNSTATPIADFESPNSTPLVFYDNNTGKIVVLAEDNTYLSSSYELFDIQGRKHQTGSIDSQRYKIRADGLRPGVYLLRILPKRNSNKLPVLKKVIVN